MKFIHAKIWALCVDENTGIYVREREREKKKTSVLKECVRELILRTVISP